MKVLIVGSFVCLAALSAYCSSAIAQETQAPNDVGSAVVARVDQDGAGNPILKVGVNPLQPRTVWQTIKEHKVATGTTVLSLLGGYALYAKANDAWPFTKDNKDDAKKADDQGKGIDASTNERDTAKVVVNGNSGTINVEVNINSKNNAAVMHASPYAAGKSAADLPPLRLEE